MLKRIINFSIKMFTVLFPSEKPLLFSGSDSTMKLASLVRESGHRRPLLVTGRTFLKNGRLNALLAYFEHVGCNVTVFNGIVPNPTFEVINDGLKACTENDCDSVFVVGGGSAIDAAKVIAACRANDVGVEQVVGLLKVKKTPLPCYVVPTTSGTGSEVTNASVISETETHQKKFVVDPKLVPAAAALDPLMLMSLPPHITAETGMDALTHAVEAYLSLNRFKDAERSAKLAIKLLFEYLPVAYEQGDDLEAREWVALASFLAGYAFNKSGLGYVHAISHQISAHYNTPHGLANAVILTNVLRFNASACADRLASLERMLSGVDGGMDEHLAARFIERIDALAEQIGIPGVLKDLEAKHYDTITANALREARMSYAVPRQMSRAQCKTILTAVSEGGQSQIHLKNQSPALNVSGGVS